MLWRYIYGNINDESLTCYPWSIYVEGTKVDLNVGDMLIYSGCELEHWREPFEGNVCVQTFLHYNNANGQYAHTNRFDKRPMLGIPK